MKNIRHWWIQKPLVGNMPLFKNGAVFEDFKPTIHEQNCEWIKVISLDDFHKEVNINITRWIEVSKELHRVKQQNALMKEALEFYENSTLLMIKQRDLPFNISESSIMDNGDTARQVLKQLKGEKNEH
jgi:hypothetical protein